MTADNNALLESLAVMLTARMGELGVTKRQLAARIGKTYEHVRRICKGEGWPDTPLLKDICEVLDLNFQQANVLLQFEVMKPAQRDAALELAGRNPELDPIERAWGRLTKQQKQDAILLITNWAKAS